MKRSHVSPDSSLDIPDIENEIEVSPNASVRHSTPDESMESNDLLISFNTHDGSETDEELSVPVFRPDKILTDGRRFLGDRFEQERARIAAKLANNLHRK